MTRRKFLATAGAGVASGMGLYTWRVEPHRLEIVRRPLPIRLLPSRLIGKILVQISDVHVGPRVADDYVLETFRRVDALRPDIVVFTGDFISHHAGSFDQICNVYPHFPKGRIATVAVLGNHDYGPAWSHPDIAQQVVDTVQAFGIEVLRNGVREVEGLQIAGLDDLWADQFRPYMPLRQIASARAAIVLSHNPDTLDLPVWEHYEGWVLSGHTHGGQCKPPFLPPPLLPVRNRRYTSGEFALSGNRRLYISRGVGHLLQVRFNVRPEVTAFELRGS
ncbi:MAG TPA: metallophosphoesterase [Vicinamibacterales bacterium]|nr:metallophosphoesterase [Vicinamibacterales bacterium]